MQNIECSKVDTKVMSFLMSITKEQDTSKCIRIEGKKLLSAKSKSEMLIGKKKYNQKEVGIKKGGIK